MMFFDSYFSDLLSLVYPRLCNSCQRALISEEECICSFCRFHLPQTRLHKEYDNALTQIFWGRLPIETATALFYFQKKSKVQNLIHQFKYKGKKDIGVYLGKILGHQLTESVYYDKIDLIVPVPLHQEKQHKRGFNQSEIIARGLAFSLKKPLKNNNLIRITKTDTQTRKSRFKRWKNVETVFHVRKPDEFKNKNILLVDDVITTGSTLEACGQKLLEIEGSKLWLVTLAMAK